MTLAAPTLAHIPLFASLAPADIRALDARCAWRRVKAGEWVIDDHADGMDVFFVFGGRARVVIGGSGREIILRDIDDGDYFGELSAIDGQPRSAGIVALTDATVARMPASVFRETIHRHPSVCDKVMVALVGAIRALNSRVDEQVNLDVRERLCSELLRLSRKAAEGRIVVSPPPTHAELAARIGTHREAVTKGLSALERDGVISRARGAIVLADVVRLRQIIADAR
jgi:CRP-like cAMP-binding protein